MNKDINRREFMQTAAIGTVSTILSQKAYSAKTTDSHPSPKPNLVYVFADQWRAEATGYSGNPDVVTTNLDKLAEESINFVNTVSGSPVCSPHRASLMTGRYPLTTGVFINDLALNDEAVSIAEAYNSAGYETGYIGKWHLDGRGRDAFVPEHRRQGFKFWRAMECTHDYNNSYYYADEDTKLKWQGYDTIAQTKEAQNYIREHANSRPFALFLSWGPPHAPLHTAPEKYRKMFNDKNIKLRPNVPRHLHKRARKELAGYYAHIAALDDCIGILLETIKSCNLENETIFVFTSDHGDMLYSQGYQKKQKPWDESIRVPFLLRYPAVLSKAGKIDMPINTPDIMPTLLGLSGIKIPDTVEGTDFSGVLRGEEKPAENAALISCSATFGQWTRSGVFPGCGVDEADTTYGKGREYRGIRTSRYTYIRDLKGPWLFYDNEKDPYQLENLCGKFEYKRLQEELNNILSKKLQETNDDFLPGQEYCLKWGMDLTAEPKEMYLRFYQTERLPADEYRLWLGNCLKDPERYQKWYNYKWTNIKKYHKWYKKRWPSLKFWKNWRV
ncbi:MAG: sulfatase family protein, partial [Planctomycetota bacterium]|jgi:arylsulfatase A-like enzyme